MPAKKSIPSSKIAEQAVEAMTCYFCRVAETFGLPRSVALIYNALFVADRPLSFTEIVKHAGIAKGSAFTGLKMLEQMRAVEEVVIHASRSTYYRPELSLRRLAAGFLQHSLLPGLEASGRLLDTAPSVDNPKLPEHHRQRLSSLRHWHEASQGLLPMLGTLGALDSSR